TCPGVRPSTRSAPSEQAVGGSAGGVPYAAHPMGASGAGRSYDEDTVEGFGFEWSVYDQEDRDPESIQRSFDRYFSSFPWDDLPAGATGLDVGCGSGRWSDRVRARGYEVVALDAARSALEVAARRLPPGSLLQGSAVELPLADDSVDFAFSLGVLHHLPDTEGALRDVRRVLRPGAPFLVYLYYSFDNRPGWFRALWRASDAGRRVIARLPHRPPPPRHPVHRRDRVLAARPAREGARALRA